MPFLPLAEIDGTTAMRQPAHDDLVARDHLLAVDTDILPFLVRSARDDHAPGDQRAGILRPAGLHRQHGQVHVRRLDDVLPAGCPPYLARIDVSQFPEGRQFLQQIAQPVGQFGGLEEGQHLTHFAQRLHGFRAHGHGDTLRGTEQVAQQRHRCTFRVGKQQGRSACLEGAITDFRYFHCRIDRLMDALQFATGLQLAQETTQVTEFHGWECRTATVCRESMPAPPCQ